MPIQNTDTHGSSHGPVSDSEMHVGKIQEHQNQNSRGGGGKGVYSLMQCMSYMGMCNPKGYVIFSRIGPINFGHLGLQ